MDQKILDLETLVSGELHAESCLRFRFECSLGTAHKSVNGHGCRGVCRESAWI